MEDKKNIQIKIPMNILEKYIKEELQTLKMEESSIMKKDKKSFLDFFCLSCFGIDASEILKKESSIIGLHLFIRKELKRIIIEYLNL